MYDPIIISGANVILLKLKILSENWFGFEDSPPLIRMKPKVKKLTTSTKLKYFFFVKIMLFCFSTLKNEKVQINHKKNRFPKEKIGNRFSEG